MDTNETLGYYNEQSQLIKISAQNEMLDRLINYTHHSTDIS